MSNREKVLKIAQAFEIIGTKLEERLSDSDQPEEVAKSAIEDAVESLDDQESKKAAKIMKGFLEGDTGAIEALKDIEKILDDFQEDIKQGRSLLDMDLDEVDEYNKVTQLKIEIMDKSYRIQNTRFRDRLRRFLDYAVPVAITLIRILKL